LPALLAMGGCFGLALADDGLLWLACATLAGYAFYGLIVRGATRPARAAGRRLIILLVLSDLLLFELFLVLAYQAGGTSFEALRAAVATTDDPTFILGLMTLGLGAKAGVLGLHAWIFPAFRSTPLAVRIALLAFVSTAGLLGWLRLLPLGALDWPVQGVAIQWLAAATAVYALAVGFGPGAKGTVHGSLLMALTSQWLWVFAVGLQRPELGERLAELLPLLLLQGGGGLAILLLLDGSSEGRPGWPHLLVGGLAAALIAVAPLPMTGLPGSPAVGIAVHELWWPSIAVILLLGRILTGLAPGRARAGRPRPAPERTAWTWATTGASTARRWLLSSRRGFRRATHVRLPARRDAILDSLSAMASRALRRADPQSVEARLTGWETALVILVLTGFGAVWLSASP
jgi:hydrogenase-4 component B